MTERWTSFVYREFYDVPRMIVVELEKTRLLLVSQFNERLDEYECEYLCYLIPSTTDLAGSWVDLTARAIRQLGSVPVAGVRFDPTRRSKIDLSSLRLGL
jgi:hypothetical protein